MCQSLDIGPDNLYCGKWRKISKSRRDLDLDQTMPNVELSELFSYTTICSSFKWIKLLFFELSCVHTHTHTRTHTHPHTHTHTHKDGIVFRKCRKLINFQRKNSRSQS